MQARGADGRPVTLPEVVAKSPDNYLHRAAVLDSWTAEKFGLYEDQTGTFQNVAVLPRVWAVQLVHFWQTHYDRHDIKRLPEAPKEHRAAGDAMQALKHWATAPIPAWAQYPDALAPGAAELFWSAQQRLAEALTAYRPYKTTVDNVVEVVKDVGRGVQSVAEAAAETAAKPLEALAWPLALGLAALGFLFVKAKSG